MEGEEAVDDDDEATRDDCEFCRECSPHDLLYPDIPAFIERFEVFRGIRGATGIGSIYDGSIFPISTSLELNEPACLRIILVLSLSTPGDCAEWERNISLGERRKEDGGWEAGEANGICGSLEEEGGGRSLNRSSISSPYGKMLCHEFEISAVAP